MDAQDRWNPPTLGQAHGHASAAAGPPHAAGICQTTSAMPQHDSSAMPAKFPTNKSFNLQEKYNHA